MAPARGAPLSFAVLCRLGRDVVDDPRGTKQVRYADAGIPEVSQRCGVTQERTEVQQCAYEWQSCEDICVDVRSQGIFLNDGCDDFLLLFEVLALCLPVRVGQASLPCSSRNSSLESSSCRRFSGCAYLNALRIRAVSISELQDRFDYTAYQELSCSTMSEHETPPVSRYVVA